jgi:hypothetical protein
MCTRIHDCLLEFSVVPIPNPCYSRILLRWPSDPLLRKSTFPSTSCAGMTEFPQSISDSKYIPHYNHKIHPSYTSNLLYKLDHTNSNYRSGFRRSNLLRKYRNVPHKDKTGLLRIPRRRSRPGRRSIRPRPRNSTWDCRYRLRERRLLG